MKRIALGTLLLITAAVLGVGPGAMPAGSHAAYKDSSPANRSTVSNPPEQVWAEFTEPVEGDARLDVYDPCGSRVDHGNASATAYRVTVSMSADAAGTYRVAFRVVSSLDGHPTAGEFTFTSSGGAPCGADGGAAAPTSRSGSGTGGSDPGTTIDAAPSPDEAAGADDEAAASTERDGKKARGKGGGEKGRNRAVRPAAAEFVVAQEGGQAPVASDDIPLDWLLVGFGLSALIGAVAGQVYASIVGPPRKRRR